MTSEAIDFRALLQKSHEELFDEVGHLTADSWSDEASIESLGLGAGSYRDLGQAIYKRLNREAHAIVCGSGSGKQPEREKLKKILSLDAHAMSAALTGVLIYSLAVSPVIAPLVAILIIKHAVIPATEEVCSFWAKKLD